MIRGSAMTTVTDGPKFTWAFSRRKPCPSGAVTNGTGRPSTMARERAIRSAPVTRDVAEVSSSVVFRRGRKPTTMDNARPRITRTTIVSINVKPRCADPGWLIAPDRSG
jgi:hypothetical protein